MIPTDDKQVANHNLFINLEGTSQTTCGGSDARKIDLSWNWLNQFFKEEE